MNKGTLYAIYLTVFLLFIQPFEARSQSAIDSLASVYRSGKLSMEDRVTIAAQYSMALSHNNRHREAEQVLRDNIAITRKLPDTKYAAYLYGVSAMHERVLDRANNAKICLDSALYYSNHTRDKRILGYVSYCRGWLLSRDNQPVEAVRYFVEALKLLDEANRTDYKVAIYRELYSIYTEWDDADLQKKYARLSLAQAKSQNDISLIFDACMMLGGTFTDLYRNNRENRQLLDSAHYYYVHAIEVYNDDKQKVIVPSNLGHAALNLANLLMQFYPDSYKNEGIRYANLAISTGKKTNQHSFIASGYGVLSEYEMQAGNIAAARECLVNALTHVMQEAMPDRVIMPRIYRGFSAISEKEGDYKEALRYYKQYFDLYKEIYDAEKMEAGRRLEAQFEKNKQAQQMAYLQLQGEKKEQQLTLLRILARQRDQQMAYMKLNEQNQQQELAMFRLKTEKNEQELALANLRSKHHRQELVAMQRQVDANRKLNKLYILLIGVFITTLGLVYYVYRQRSKTLKQQVDIHLLELQKVTQQQEISNLTAMLDGQEQERTRLARDLHDSLGGLLSAIKIDLSQVKLADASMHVKKLVGGSLSQIDTAVDELRRVAHNLMPELVLKYGLEEAIRDYCRRMSNPSLDVEAQFFKYSDTLDMNTQVVVYRIIQELVNNALKHAQASQILVQLQENDDSYFLTVEDDGRGFDVQSLNNNRSAGIHNIRARLQFLDGDMHIDSKIGQGTTIEINFPRIKNNVTNDQDSNNG